MLCALVLCLLLFSPNSSKAEGIPATDARTAAKKFQNALTQQSLQTVLLSIEERLRNLDRVYAMQYSPSVEGKLEMYGRKLESVEAKISRLEAVMGNELDKISENISSRNFKDDLGRDHVLRKIDSAYERMNHRLIFAESKMELMERKLENKLDTVLSRMEKMEDNFEIKHADLQGEIAEVLTCVEELKTQPECIARKPNNVTKVVNHNAGLIQSDETVLSLTSENITATVRKDMKENFEVLSNKIVDFHETSWQTYDRLERTLRSMSLVSNLTRYEIQNGLRSLTVEVGRLGGLLSDSPKGKSKLHEIDKKIESNFESLMLAQNLFMESCYRLQQDEPQLETKISEVLNEMIDTFNAKTAVAPEDIRKLEQTIKTHDAGVKNALKTLSTLVHKSHVTETKIKDGLNSLSSIKIDLNKLNALHCDNNDTNPLSEKIEDAIELLKNLQGTVTSIKPPMENEISAVGKFRESVDRLGNLSSLNDRDATLNSIKGYVENMSKILEEIENKTNIIGFIFTDGYERHLRLFLDEYGKKLSEKGDETYGNTTGTGRELDPFGVSNETIQAIKRNCFQANSDLVRDMGNFPIFSCLDGILDESQRRTIKVNCLFNLAISDEDCLRNVINLEPIDATIRQPDILGAIRTNCFSPNVSGYFANISNFGCLRGILNEYDLDRFKHYCIFYNTPSEEACLRNLTGLEITPGGEMVEEFDRDTMETIKANCFPSFSIRSNENLPSFRCLNRVVDEGVVNRVKNYCASKNLLSEEECLRNITRNKSIDGDVEEISGEIIDAIRADCYPVITLRLSQNLSLFECLKVILNETAVRKIEDYCDRIVVSSREDCLRNITSTASNVKVTTGLITTIKTNCVPEIDVRSSDEVSISGCAKRILNESDISDISNYCFSVVRKGEEECLRDLIDLKDFSVFSKINDKIREMIRANCLSRIDIRSTTNSSNFQCLKNVLSEDDVKSIEAYCNSMMSTMEACLTTIINANTTRTNIAERNSDGEAAPTSSSNVKVTSPHSTQTAEQLPERALSDNATAITEETTTETDYYQALETTEHNEYDDYGIGVY